MGVIDKGYCLCYNIEAVKRIYNDYMMVFPIPINMNKSNKTTGK